MSAKKERRGMHKAKGPGSSAETTLRQSPEMHDAAWAAKHLGAEKAMEFEAWRASGGYEKEMRKRRRHKIT